MSPAKVEVLLGDAPQTVPKRGAEPSGHRPHTERMPGTAFRHLIPE